MSDMCKRWQSALAPYAIVPLRLGLGLIFIAHGGQKLFGLFGGAGIEGTEKFFSMIGIVPAPLFAWLAALAEFGGGILVLLGLWTSLGAALIAIVMVVAFFTVHITRGFFAGDGGYEFVLMNFLAAISVMFSGAGRCSLDARCKSKKSMTAAAPNMQM